MGIFRALYFLAVVSAVPLRSPTELGIVCARFKEALEPWVPVSSVTYLYAKGNVTNDTIPHSSFRSYVDLENTGREGQTYLQHIVNHYDSLEDVMIFTQADPFDLLAPIVNTTAQMVSLALRVPAGDVTPFNRGLYHDLAEWGAINWNSPAEIGLWITESQIKTLTPAPFTPGDYWRILLAQDHPPAIRAMHGGIFAVRRETIRKQPKVVYERALGEFERANAVNPEVGYFQERMWAPLFSSSYWLGSLPNQTAQMRAPGRLAS